MDLQIIINTAINHYHSPNNSRFSKQMDRGFEGEPNQEYEDIIDRLNNRQLMMLINDLPDGYRIVFNLYVIDGFPHREIAEMLNISVGTSKSQLYEAKNRLKMRLKKLGIVRYEKTS